MVALTTGGFTPSFAGAKPDSFLLRSLDGGLPSIAEPPRNRRPLSMRRGCAQCEVETDPRGKDASASKASSLSALEQFKAFGTDRRPKYLVDCYGSP